MKKITVAIDGYSSCGKSTIAKELAQYAGYTYIDTGAMYRAVALYFIQNGWIDDQQIDQTDIENKLQHITITFETHQDNQQETYLNGENVEKKIRSLQVADAASRISTLPAVRTALVRQQQAMGSEQGVVMDGRDIGTVVFPDAALKIFLTASPEVRAKRRFEEMKRAGETPQYEQVLANVKERDLRDTTRQESPLRQAPDAILIDNSTLTREQQRTMVRKLFDQQTK